MRLDLGKPFHLSQMGARPLEGLTGARSVVVSLAWYSADLNANARYGRAAGMSSTLSRQETGMELW